MFRLNRVFWPADRSIETPLYIVSLYLIFFSLLGFIYSAIQRGVFGDWSAWLPLSPLPMLWDLWVIIGMFCGVMGLMLNSFYCTVRELWRRFRVRQAGRKNR